MVLPHHLLLFYFYKAGFADILFFLRKINLGAGEKSGLDWFDYLSKYINREACGRFEK